MQNVLNDIIAKLSTGIENIRYANHIIDRMNVQSKYVSGLRQLFSGNHQFLDSLKVSFAGNSSMISGRRPSLLGQH
jgi:hypothetical protein